MRVCFSHAGPCDPSEHEAFFDCEVRFGAEYDGLEFDSDTLAIPLPGADADLSHFLIEHLRYIAADKAAVAPATLEGRVRQAICDRVGDRTLAMTAVAQELDASAFHRAYVRWTGSSPVFRRRVQQGPDL